MTQLFPLNVQAWIIRSNVQAWKIRKKHTRNPAALATIGVGATFVLALIVVIILLLTGGASSIPTNAALLGALIALGGVFTTQLVNTGLEGQRAREAALQKYYEQVGKLQADKDRPLHRSTLGDNVSTLVRAQTLAVLQGLDPERKRILLQFLHESNLINAEQPVISLVGADLSVADLSDVDLPKTNLSKADLTMADLTDADLNGANLIEAKLIAVNLGGVNLLEANLRKAELLLSKLIKANLVEANLREAELGLSKLSGANLSGADLSDADLSGANLSGANLSGANLSGTKLGWSKLSGTDLSGVNLSGAVDLIMARKLTQEQINEAYGDENIQLPDHLQRPEHWKKSSPEECEE